MKKLLIAVLAVSLMNCQKEAITPQKGSPMYVFDDLWRFIDVNYAYFDYKGIDWQQKRGALQIKNDNFFIYAAIA